MKKHDVDIIALQETHISYTGRLAGNNMEIIPSTFQVLSQTTLGNKQKVTWNTLLNDAEESLLLKTRQNGKECQSFFKVQKKLQVGGVYRRSKFSGTTTDISSIDNRLMTMTVHTAPIKLQLTNVYAPHSGHTAHTKNAFLRYTTSFHAELTCPSPKPNTWRFQRATLRDPARRTSQFRILYLPQP